MSMPKLNKYNTLVQMYKEWLTKLIMFIASLIYIRITKKMFKKITYTRKKYHEQKYFNVY